MPIEMRSSAGQATLAEGKEPSAKGGGGSPVRSRTSFTRTKFEIIVFFPFPTEILYTCTSWCKQQT